MSESNTSSKQQDFEIGNFHITLSHSDGLDSAWVDVVRAYWSMDQFGKWTYSTKQLEEWSGMHIVSLVHEMKVATDMSVRYASDIACCVSCKRGLEVTSRSDYKNLIERRIAESNSKNSLICKECEALDYECEHFVFDEDSDLSLIYGKKGFSSIRRAYYGCDDVMRQFEQSDALLLSMARSKYPFWNNQTWLQCDRCGGDLVVPGPSREEFHQDACLLEARCVACDHHQHVQMYHIGNEDDVVDGVKYYEANVELNCSCVHCQQQASKIETKRDRINKHWTGKAKPLAVESLTFKGLVGLMALLWTSISEDGTHIQPEISLSSQSLTPNPNLDVELIREAFKCGALKVDAPATPTEAFTDDGERVTLMRATFLANVSLYGETPLRPRDLLMALCGMLENGGWVSSWDEEVKEVWKLLALEECMEYSTERSNHYGLPEPGEDKMRALISGLLDRFSVSEVWYFIATSYLGAAGFYQSREAHGKKHATNTIFGRIEKVSQKPRTEIKGFHRIQSLPRSAMSEVLFSTIFQTKDDFGFYQPVGKAWSKLLDGKIRPNQPDLNRLADAENLWQSLPEVQPFALREWAEGYQDAEVMALVEKLIAGNLYIVELLAELKRKNEVF